MTRIYLPSSGAAAVTPSDWEFANQSTPVTYAGVLTKGTSALTTKTISCPTTNPTLIAIGRWVIGPLNAVQISGTVNLCVMARESSTGCNTTLAVAVKIIQPGGADRSILLAPVGSDSATSTYELTATLSSRRAYSLTETRPIDLTPQTPTAGDYLVIECGFRAMQTTSSRTLDFRYGDNSANDLADGQGATDDYAPWIDFSQTLSWQGKPDISLSENLALAEANPTQRMSQLLMSFSETANFAEGLPTIGIASALMIMSEALTFDESISMTMGEIAPFIGPISDSLIFSETVNPVLSGIQIIIPIS